MFKNKIWIIALIISLLSSVLSPPNVNVFAKVGDSDEGPSVRYEHGVPTGHLMQDFNRVTLATTSTKYRTVGFRIKIYTPYGGPYMTIVKVDDSNFLEGKKYADGTQDFKFKMKFIPTLVACSGPTTTYQWNRSIWDNFMLEYAGDETSKRAITQFLGAGGTVYVDSIMTTVVNGVQQGDIRNGAKWNSSTKYTGTVYDTKEGILSAANWSQGSRNDLQTKYFYQFVQIKPQEIAVLDCDTKGKAITNYFAIDENRKVVSELDTPNVQEVTIPAGGSVSVSGKYKDMGGYVYRGYSITYVGQDKKVSVGTYLNDLQTGTNATTKLTSKLKEVHFNYFYEKVGTDPYLTGTITATPSQYQFDGNDVKVDVKVTGEIKNLSNTNLIQGWEIWSYKDGESVNYQRVSSANKTLTYSNTFSFIIPKNKLDGINEYVQKFIGRPEVTINGKLYLVPLSAETKVFKLAQPTPPPPPPKPKAEITIGDLTVDRDDPPLPSGYEGHNTVDMIAGERYWVVGRGIPGAGTTIDRYQWSIGMADDKSTLNDKWSGYVVYPLDQIGKMQGITLVVTDNLGQSAFARMYVNVIAPPPVAEFTPEPNPAYAGETVQLINQSTDYKNEPLTATWIIKDPLGEVTTQSTWDGQITNALKGNYEITLMVENSRDQRSEKTKIVQIFGPPRVEISFPTSSDLNYPDVLNSGDRILWNYLQDTVSKKGQEQFEVVIRRPGNESIVSESGTVRSSASGWKPTGLASNITYSVEVRVSDGTKWSEWSEIRYFVYNNQPLAQFEHSPMYVYEGENFDLINLSTDPDLIGIDALKAGLQVLWTVEHPNGDVTTHDQWDIQIENALRGEYKVSLRVIDVYGAWSATYPTIIRVWGFPTASIYDPASEDVNKPTIYMTSSPTIKWNFTHPDGLPQKKKWVRIKRASDDTVVADSGEIFSSQWNWNTTNLNGGEVLYAEVLVNDGQRWSKAWSDRKYFLINQPPVADFKPRSDSYYTSQTIEIENKSSDADGDPLTMVWTVRDPKFNYSSTTRTTWDDLVIPNAIEGEYLITLEVTDVHGAKHKKGPVSVFVLNSKPQAVLDITGTLKVNRKITLDGSKSTSNQTFPLDQSKNRFTITPITSGISSSDVFPLYTIVGKKVEDILVKKEGLYQVQLYVENTAGFSDQVEQQMYIVPDLPPIADFTVSQNIHRNPADGNLATITVVDSSESPDGDFIQDRTWKIFYNSDNDKDGYGIPIFTNEVPLTLKDSDLVEGIEQSYMVGGVRIHVIKNGSVLTVKVPDVGRYLVDLVEVKEGFGQPTIPAYITDADYLRDDTTDKNGKEKIVTVWNKKPSADFQP